MSACHRVQDASGVVARDQIGNVLIVCGNTVPTDGTAGYATGCLFIKLNGGAGTSMYANEGTSASSDFDAISVA